MDYYEPDDPDRYCGDDLSWDAFVEWMGANELQRALAVLAYPEDGDDRRIYLAALLLPR